jgi:uncharacterized protein YqjF (DUF2071 family)
MALEELFRTAARQAAVADDSTQRPWPLPDEEWTSAQSWVDLAFLHWRVEADALRPLVPQELELQRYDGSAYLGIVPFVLSDLRFRGLLPVPGFSTFPELNVRTYVTLDERPGVWFFSLDAASQLMVEGAKRFYKLPYERAQMRCERIDDFVHYESARSGAAFSGRYRGEGDLFHAEPGSLEAFLVERYCLYTADGGRLYRAEVHHAPWTIQHGEAVVDLNTMSPVPLPDDEPHVLFAPRQDVVVWPLHQIA